MGQEEGDVLENVSSDLNMSCDSRGSKLCSSQEQVRSKMEAMQKRIDELKAKVKYEGDFLVNEALSVSSEISVGKNSSSDLQKHSGSNSTSDLSLYFSASNFSTSSLLSSDSTDSAQENFSKFVGNFVRDQNYKERLSLLQLHSHKQISMNLMRKSLTELDARCSRELDLVQTSLRQLEKLAAEIDLSCYHHHQDDSFEETEGESLVQVQKSQTTAFLWPPLVNKTTLEIDWKKITLFGKSNDDEK